jgi:hypothetical protein
VVAHEDEALAVERCVAMVVRGDAPFEHGSWHVIRARNDAESVAGVPRSDVDDHRSVLCSGACLLGRIATDLTQRAVE